MITVIVIMTALAALCAALSWWADRNPCEHTEVTFIDTETVVCEICDQVLRFEDVGR